MQLHSQIQDLHQKHQIDLLLNQLLWQGITSVNMLHSLGDPMDHYPKEYVMLFQQQATIGWDQLFAGCIEHSWSHQLTHHSEQTSGMHFYAKVVQILWRFIPDIWIECNQNLHNQDKTYDQTQVQQLIKQIFHDAAQHPATMALIKQQMPENILTKPLKTIRQWAERSQFHMQAQAKALTLQAKLKTQDIQSFFQSKPHNNGPNSSNKNLLQPP